MTSSRRGLFITFEGPEGAGKSLQARLLADRLRAEGHTVILTREPGGTPFGDRLRDVLLLQGDLTIGPRAQALLLSAARAQHVDEIIEPALAAGHIVICDRYADSTLAYQGAGLGLDAESLAQVQTFATNGLQPDLTFLLDLPVEIGLARKSAQSQGNPDEWNRFESAVIEFHERVRQGYRSLAADANARWRLFDATRPPEEITPLIWHEMSLALTTRS